MDNRLNKNDVVFEDTVFFDSDEEISVYLSQNKSLNKISGTEFTDCDLYQTNFYGIYNFKTGDFKVVSMTTLYVAEKEIREYMPDIADKVMEMAKKDENILDLTSGELDLAFDVFKDYCKKDLSCFANPAGIDFKEFIQKCSKLSQGLSA